MEVKIAFVGNGLSREEYELLALGIDPTHRAGEADLFKTRWVEYAEMHPARATYLYAHFYKEQTRTFYETCIDIETAQFVRAFSPNDIFKSRDMTAMWLARRACDALGCPYDFALRFAQQRAVNRLYKTFPRPNQLYSEEFVIDLSEAWNESLAMMLRYSRHERFKAVNYCGSWGQRRHTAAVFEQIKKRPAASQVNLLGRLVHEGVLDEKLMENSFPGDVISRAVEVAGNLAM